MDEVDGILYVWIHLKSINFEHEIVTKEEKKDTNINGTVQSNLSNVIKGLS